MKLSELIHDLQAIQRRHGEMRCLLYGLDNEEADLVYADAEWSDLHGRYALVLATSNYTPTEQPQNEPPERDEPIVYERGELPPRDSQDEHDRTLGPAY